MTSGSQVHRGSDSRIWLKQYPAGVPADIDATPYASLVELLEASFAAFRNRQAFICMERSISYDDLDQMSLALAAYLQSKRLQKGARVALMMPNVLQHPVATVAVLRAGYAAVVRHVAHHCSPPPQCHVDHRLELCEERPSRPQSKCRPRSDLSVVVKTAVALKASRIK